MHAQKDKKEQSNQDSIYVYREKYKQFKFKTKVGQLQRTHQSRHPGLLGRMRRILYVESSGASPKAKPKDKQRKQSLLNSNKKMKPNA